MAETFTYSYDTAGHVPSVHIPGETDFPPGISTPLTLEMAYGNFKTSDRDLPRRLEDGRIPLGIIKAEDNFRRHGVVKQSDRQPISRRHQSYVYADEIEQRKNAVIARGLKEISLAKRRGDTQWDHDRGGLGGRSPLKSMVMPPVIPTRRPYEIELNEEELELEREARVAGIGFGRGFGVGSDTMSSYAGWWDEGVGVARPRTLRLKF